MNSIEFLGKLGRGMLKISNNNMAFIPLPPQKITAFRRFFKINKKNITVQYIFRNCRSPNLYCFQREVQESPWSVVALALFVLEDNKTNVNIMHAQNETFPENLSLTSEVRPKQCL